jgi:hypothetical protein
LQIETLCLYLCMIINETIKKNTMKTFKRKELKLNNKVFRITEILGTYIVDRFEEYVTEDKQTSNGYVYKFSTNKENELNEVLKFLSK